MKSMTTHKLVNVAQLHEFPGNPRAFNAKADAAALGELAEDIKRHGLIEPIIVRRVEGGLQLIAGRRRCAAAAMAGIDALDAVIYEDLSDDDAHEIALAENVHRVNLTPMEEAHAFRALTVDAARRDLGAREVAARVGKSERHVARRMKLLDLIAPLQRALAAGVLGVTLAETIACLSATDQKEALKRLSDWGWKPRDVERWIADEVFLRLDRVPWALDDADLVPTAGTCAACPKRTGNAPALFDVGAKDLCMDAECFNTKHTAALKVTVERLSARDGGVNVVALIEPGMNTKGAKALAEAAGALVVDTWTPIARKDARCASTRPAIDMSPGALGKSSVVCIARKCDVHKGELPSVSNARGVDPAQQKREQDKRRKDNIRKRAHDTALDAAFAGDVVRGRVDDVTIDHALRAAVLQVSLDIVRAVVKRAGWMPDKPPKDGFVSVHPILEKRIAAMDRDALHVMLARVNVCRLDMAARSEYDNKAAPAFRHALLGFGVRLGEHEALAVARAAGKGNKAKKAWGGKKSPKAKAPKRGGKKKGGAT